MANALESLRKSCKYREQRPKPHADSVHADYDRDPEDKRSNGNLLQVLASSRLVDNRNAETQGKHEHLPPYAGYLNAIHEYDGQQICHGAPLRTGFPSLFLR